MKVEIMLKNIKDEPVLKVCSTEDLETVDLVLINMPDSVYSVEVSIDELRKALRKIAVK